MNYKLNKKQVFELFIALATILISILGSFGIAFYQNKAAEKTVFLQNKYEIGREFISKAKQFEIIRRQYYMEYFRLELRSLLFENNYYDELTSKMHLIEKIDRKINEKYDSKYIILGAEVYSLLQVIPKYYNDIDKTLIDESINALGDSYGYDESLIEKKCKELSIDITDGGEFYDKLKEYIEKKYKDEFSDIANKIKNEIVKSISK
ncbi:hypothetical protein IMX26_15420 [Clostridium sp. 'deep sea']|uniref:hypothetical protein n=1 Tax=Clostridium sp. 'deep sea' TaxID=2779445 RepID=UPI001896739A|nr:hypothetical protein [Clostridium sp. 'deep sea']QOR34831.1 hypothetical protein IMX26_15420 [Clostridium sp. 'deep sea']